MIIMKKTNKLLSALAVTIALCALFTACSGGDENNTDNPQSDMPQLSVDMSDSAQTTPDNPALNENSDTPENTVSEETSQSEETPQEPATETTERPETSIIEETTSSEMTSSAEEAAAPAEITDGNGVVQLAAAQEGKPFYFGGSDPETGFDNSGLIYYVLNQNGITCPRLTFEIAEMGTKIGYDELQAGDIVFFEYEGSGKADFGGIYIGDGMMIVSTDEDRPVSKVDITTNYYQRTFQYGIKIGR